MIKAVIFDFDGVIVDSEPLHFLAYQEVLAPYGISITRDDYYSRYLGYDDVGVFLTVLKNARSVTTPSVDELIREKGRVFERLSRTTDIIIPSAAACVRRLAVHFSLGIASGSLRHEIEHVLAEVGLRQLFVVIVSASESSKSKPDPEPYRLAVEHVARQAFGTDGLRTEECVAIEDSVWGIRSAQEAGLRCVAVTGTYAAGDLAGADAIIDSLDRLTVSFIRQLE